MLKDIFYQKIVVFWFICILSFKETRKWKLKQRRFKDVFYFIIWWVFLKNISFKKTYSIKAFFSLFCYKHNHLQFNTKNNNNAIFLKNIILLETLWKFVFKLEPCTRAHARLAVITWSSAQKKLLTGFKTIPIIFAHALKNKTIIWTIIWKVYKTLKYS